MHRQEVTPEAGRGRDDRRGRPNIVLILADDLGYGDLGCYGQKTVPTPHLDRMAREGTRFTNFYAGSTVCAPSRCVLLTGLHTGHAHVRGNGKTALRPDEPTLPELLKRAGYATGHFGKWGLGGIGSGSAPTRRGFDDFVGFLDHGHAHNYYPEFLWKNERRLRLANTVPGAKPSGAGVAAERNQYAPDVFADEAVRWLERRERDRPFFLYYAPTLPHANNEAGRRGMEHPDDDLYRQFAGKDWPDTAKRFAAMVARLDRDVGRVLDALKRQNADGDTLVLFSSDNGPHREGGNDPNYFDSNGPLRGIKRDLYEGGIRVPFLARWPGKVAAGRVSDHVGGFQDVLPTLCALGGAETPRRTDGVSIVPALTGRGRQRRHDRLYWEFYERGGARAVREGRWKAVRQPWHGPVQLYDLEADPGETADIAAKEPAVAARLRDAMDREHTPSPAWKAPEAEKQP